MSQNNKIKGRQRLITGIVISDKMDKTVVVKIDRITSHPVYRKVMRKSHNIKAHDEKNAAKTGDVVKIVRTRPFSKDKRWKVAEVTERPKA
jgi:small subunit ribosomal protein S17